MSPFKEKVIPVDTHHLWTPDPQWNGDTSGWDSVHSYRRLIPMAEINEYPIAKKYDPNTGWCIKLNINGLRIEGSLPRLKSSNNFDPITISDFPILLEYLDHLQSMLGLSFDPMSLRIGRVDIFRHLEVPYPAPLLIKQLSKLYRFQHLVQKASAEFYGYSYVRWQNKSREMVLYDKSAQSNKRRNKT